MGSSPRQAAIGALAATSLLALSAGTSAPAANPGDRSVPRGQLAVAAASASANSLRVRPRRVRAGRSVTVDGYARGCPDAVSLISRAFSAREGRFAGSPMITADIRNDAGYYRTQTTIPRTRRPGRYSITGRCGGGNIGATATLRVLAPGS